MFHRHYSAFYPRLCMFSAQCQVRGPTEEDNLAIMHLTVTLSVELATKFCEHFHSYRQGFLQLKLGSLSAKLNTAGRSALQRLADRAHQCCRQASKFELDSPIPI